jgi:hypothetical protein
MLAGDDPFAPEHRAHLIKRRRLRVKQLLDVAFNFLRCGLLAGAPNPRPRMRSRSLDPAPSSAVPPRLRDGVMNTQRGSSSGTQFRQLAPAAVRAGADALRFVAADAFG